MNKKGDDPSADEYAASRTNRQHLTEHNQLLRAPCSKPIETDKKKR